MAPRLDVERRGRIDTRPHPVLGARQFRQRRCHIEPRQRRCRFGDRSGIGQDACTQFLQMSGLGGQRMIAGLGNAHRQPRFGAQQRVGKTRRNFDMIAENAIVTDLQRCNAGRFA